MDNLKLIFSKNYFIYHVRNAVCKSYVPVSETIERTVCVTKWATTYSIFA